MATDELEGIIKDFLVESHENLDRLDRDFVAWEQRPGDRELVAGIFRSIHTIKGTCGFLGFPRLQKVTHAGENLLAMLRDGKLALRREMTTTLLETVDAIRKMLGEIEATRSDGKEDYSNLLANLERLQTQQQETLADWNGTPSAPADQENPSPSQETPAPAPVPPSGGAAGGSLAETSLRVDVALLDKLMNQIGELVLTRNQFLQLADGLGDSGLHLAAQKLSRVTSEMQEALMKTRMQSIGGLWGKYPRMIRDLAQACGKQVRLAMEGKETELDRSLIEALKDPLTHILRNSVDHGIEAPERRLALGKPAEGTLALHAFHENGQVVIEIRDDGKGLDPGRIKAKAVEKGILTSARAAEMGDDETRRLIFLPGFSTAEKVTQVSGRGVGMDVVRTNIEAISGSIDVESEVDAGTTLRIRVPLTMAILPALIVGDGEEQYAIPQAQLQELIRTEGAPSKGLLGAVDGRPVYRLRGQLLPLVHLGELLGTHPGATAGLIARDNLQFLVLQSDGERFGLVVDRVLDTQEIVVKPLARVLKDLRAYSGATILGNGRMALILDVKGLAARVGASAPVDPGAPPAAVASSAASSQPYLVAGLADRSRLAVPLSQILRLEKVAAKALERAGEWDLLQYRGEIIPVLHLDEALGRGAPPYRDGEREEIPMLVVNRHGRTLGVSVRMIEDILPGDSGEGAPSMRPGTVSALVLGGQVAEVVDLDTLLLSKDPEFFSRTSSPKGTA